MGLAEGIVKGKKGFYDDKLTVSELIWDEGGWNEERVRRLFPANEANAILNTPVRETSTVNGIRWQYENNGQFSVSSAYKLYMGGFEGHPNTSKKEETWWGKHVWKLNIQPKVKIFLWRLFRDFVPTVGNLRIHHVPVDGICRQCNDRWDTSIHTIFFCPAVREVWRKSGFWEVIRAGQMVGTKDIAEAIRKVHGAAEYEVWCTLAWQTWRYVCRKSHDADTNGKNMRLPSIEESRATMVAVLDAQKICKVSKGLGIKCRDKNGLD